MAFPAETRVFAAPGDRGDVLAALHHAMVGALFADRFFVTRAGRAIDLATGEPAWIRTLAFPDTASRERWLARAAALRALWHPHVVALADFGADGRGADFEAWLCEPPPHRRWRLRDERSSRALGDAAAVLCAHGFGTGRRRWSDAFDVNGRLVVWPGEEAPGPAQREGRSAFEADERALHEVAERVAEMLDAGVSGRPRSVRVPVGWPALHPRAVLAIARCARLHGYVPVSARLVANVESASAPWLRAVADRHVVVLRASEEARLREAAAFFFLTIGLANDRPHVLLAVVPPAPDAECLPARSTRVTRVAEESAPYSAGAVIASWSPALVPGRHPGDTTPDVVVQAASAGRHAQVERWLREAGGRSARRGDEAGAGEASLALGRLCLWRGRLADAARAFDMARRHFSSARLCGRASVAATFAGLCLTDGARFSDAESALRAAAVAAAEVTDEAARALASQGLARCLLWQRRFDEAYECLRGGPPVSGFEPAAQRASGGLALRERPAPFDSGWPVYTIDAAVAHACLDTRAAIGAGDLGAAGRAAAAARLHACHAGHPADQAAACRVRALFFAAIGDLAATREQVAEGLAAARCAHDPLRAIRLRLVLIEALLREGNQAEARPLLARLSRLDAARVPPLVSRQLETLVGHSAGRRGRHTPTAAALTGSSRTPAVRRTSLAEAVVEVLAVCQSEDDEREALKKVAGILRARCRALSVACYAGDEGGPAVLVADGSGHPADGVAARAIQSGLSIAPTSSPSGLEAAVPIRSAGLVIGAWGCRWSIDDPPDWARSADLLAAAAAAVAAALRAAVDRRASPVAEGGTGEMLGVSQAVVALRAEIVRAAAAPFNVVIEGESGCGKELVAKAIHRLGPRARRPLCAVNCAALTDELLEAELFGHARGAFTGALSERKGLFEEAHGGTLVLDEVGELTPRAQAKLLRAIQEGEVRRLGENLPRAVDVRIVAASNRPLRAAAESGAFRADLLYRLEVIRIAVPPLRHRVEDIPVLAAHFWAEAVARLGSRCTLSPATLAALARYDWPGNVRELQNVMSALAVGAGRRGSVGPERLPAVIGRHAASTADTGNLEDARRIFELGFVRAALARAGGRRAQAASDLGLTRQGFTKLLARLGITE